MISLTGWSLEYVGRHMTLPRLYEMQHFLAQHPPVGDLVAAYLGYKPPGKKGKGFGTPAELMAEFGAIGGKIKRQPKTENRVSTENRKPKTENRL